MRLAQLARKLSVKTSDVVDFFATHSIFVEDAPNSKIEDDHTRKAIIHFAPHLLEEQVQELAQQPDEIIQGDEPSDEVYSKVAGTDTELLTHNVSDEALSNEVRAAEELPDVIRAPKVELSGLKVLGKIELPEKKKKEETAPLEGVEAEAADARESRRQKKQNAPRNKRNVVSEARQRELRAMEEKRKQEEEQRKELRKQSYLRTREAKAPTKKAKQASLKRNEPAAVNTHQSKPTTLLGRFLRWLTSNQ